MILEMICGLTLMFIGSVIGFIFGNGFGYVNGANTHCICPNCGAQSHKGI